jgi:hypothetical protein
MMAARFGVRSAGKTHLAVPRVDNGFDCQQDYEDQKSHSRVYHVGGEKKSSALPDDRDCFRTQCDQ